MIEKTTTYKQGHYSDMDIIELMQLVDKDQRWRWSATEFKEAGRRIQSELAKRDLTDVEIVEIVENP